jgi:hypothetical protein
MTAGSALNQQGDRMIPNTTRMLHRELV